MPGLDTILPRLKKFPVMSVKVYGYPGRTTATVRIPTLSGKSYIICEFTRGCISSANYHPATFVTTNPVYQNIIESSPMFGKDIILLREHASDNGESSKKPAPRGVSKPRANSKQSEQPKVEDSPESEVKEFAEVNSRESAVEILKSLGAKATELVNDEAMIAYMKKNKISFPNYQF